jgi:hypothetical protein
MKGTSAKLLDFGEYSLQSFGKTTPGSLQSILLKMLLSGTGVLEYWSVGVLRKSHTINDLLFHYSTTPPLS